MIVASSVGGSFPFAPPEVQNPAYGKLSVTIFINERKPPMRIAARWRFFSCDPTGELPGAGSSLDRRPFPLR